MEQSLPRDGLGMSERPSVEVQKWAMQQWKGYFQSQHEGIRQGKLDRSPDVKSYDQQPACQHPISQGLATLGQQEDSKEYGYSDPKYVEHVARLQVMRESSETSSRDLTSA
ncbi:hypothetical protein [Pontibacter sp. G13]|uniref:hypothetical protein n=1 Tax=Pontibacter sp. G13 TaxID=3074898 RepID=UPI00288AFFD4|nr:hypothetical protein [Pontibacter sp. G13]WNJ19038.1 hypothetical protein RJD25_00985 [Pontibacter sp. G13]